MKVFYGAQITMNDNGTRFTGIILSDKVSERPRPTKIREESKKKTICTLWFDKLKEAQNFLFALKDKGDVVLNGIK